MAHLTSLPAPKRPIVSHRAFQLLLVLGAFGLALLIGRVLTAQVEGERGIAAVVSSTDIDVAGIEVDVSGENAQDARESGWREAQRKAWAKIDGPNLSDSQLDSIVSSIVIEKERIGPRRYVATLGVIFDSARAGRYLGGNSKTSRSAPMLLIPVTISGGTEMVYEQRNPWQRVWAEYQAGSSRINYVRPSGAGADSLLITYGQLTRRSRLWWRNILDSYDAADVLMPIARLQYQYPGGPVKGTFTARYGPDNTSLGSFTLTAKNDADLPRMLKEAVRRFDAVFSQAMTDGKLKPDPTLNFGAQIDPALQRLIEIGNAAAREQERAASAARSNEAKPATDATPEPSSTPTPTPTVAAAASYVVQFASPDAGAIDATLAAVRATGGVRGASTTSLAIGGTSVMSVTYGGSIGELAAALRARGFTVNQGANALAIRR